eukprot:CAMPEP_0167777356 /NCGR_PEP_ID=MMETSP0111_2-20121227/3647_1 /TAXON_ID=91324 /ORGANISM="Lotharella globosa, Strain CCCM811" /LENGTH=44 /DNA_ID= /DNA_START= /DNA_END= /DNA_ORIENTATION=
MSEKNIRNSTGDRTVPWGTPLAWNFEEDTVDFILVTYLLARNQS